MTLKELAKNYHYKIKTVENVKAKFHKDQTIINFLSDKTDEELWGGAFGKAYRSFETYLTFFKKQDLLIKKGINPKLHRDYRLTK